MKAQKASTVAQPIKITPEAVAAPNGGMHSVAAAFEGAPGLLSTSEGLGVPKPSEDLRIHQEQLVVENDAFLCRLCNFIAPSPVITVCSHIFCQGCFQNHVDGMVKVAKGAGKRVSGVLPTPWL